MHPRILTLPPPAQNLAREERCGSVEPRLPVQHRGAHLHREPAAPALLLADAPPESSPGPQEAAAGSEVECGTPPFPDTAPLSPAARTPTRFTRCSEGLGGLIVRARPRARGMVPLGSLALQKIA